MCWAPQCWALTLSAHWLSQHCCIFNVLMNASTCWHRKSDRTIHLPAPSIPPSSSFTARLPGTPPSSIRPLSFSFSHTCYFTFTHFTAWPIFCLSHESPPVIYSSMYISSIFSSRSLVLSLQSSHGRLIPLSFASSFDHSFWFAMSRFTFSHTNLPKALNN